MKSTWLAAVVIALLLVAFRILAHFAGLHSFSPLPAIFLCSVVFLRGRQAWLLPLGAWLVSNPIMSVLQGSDPLSIIGPEATAFLTMLAIGLCALALRARPTALRMLGAGILAGVLFHAVTGIVGWLAYPVYPKNLIGLEQSLWSGPAGSALPSWIFLRNLVCANIIFTAGFLALWHYMPLTADKAEGAPAAGR